MTPASLLRQNLRDAVIAAVLTALVTIPIFGLHLERAGGRTVIVPHWTTVAWACALVFVVQLLRPWLARGFARMPRLQRPALPAATQRQRQGLMLAAL
ncbi:MAG: DUF3382 domain-containing protein, partial [Comamonas sp.]